VETRQVDSRNAPSDAKSDAAFKINLNPSNQLRFAMLTAISMSKAEEIVGHRPDAGRRQPVSRGILTEEQYRRTAADVTTCLGRIFSSTGASTNG